MKPGDRIEMSRPVRECVNVRGNREIYQPVPTGFVTEWLGYRAWSVLWDDGCSGVVGDADPRVEILYL